MAAKSNAGPDAETPAVPPAVADTLPAVEAAASEPPAAQPEEVEAQRPHADDLWQTDARVWLTYTGEPSKVYIPLGELRPGDTRSVPASLVASYLATKNFVPAAA